MNSLSFFLLYLFIIPKSQYFHYTSMQLIFLAVFRHPLNFNLAQVAHLLKQNVQAVSADHVTASATAKFLHLQSSRQSSTLLFQQSAALLVLHPLNSCRRKLPTTQTRHAHYSAHILHLAPSHYSLL